MERFKHPISNYVKAFMKWSGASKSELQHARHGSHILILYKDRTYMVSHYDDFKDEYVDYFSRKCYDEIYTQTHEGVFDIMIKEGYVNIDPAKMITGLYRKWNAYWEDQKKEVKGEEWYKQLRSESWERLQVLFHAIHADSTEVVPCGSKLEGLEFVPMIALWLKDQYDMPDEFFDTAIDILLENGSAFVTMGDTWAEVIIDQETDKEDIYYISDPILEFKDLKEIDSALKV